MLATLKVFYAQASRWALPVLAVILFFSIKSCSSKADQVNALTLNIDSTARAAQHVTNQRGQDVAQNKQLTSDPTQLKALTDQIFALKKENNKNLATVTQYAQVIQEFNGTNKFAAFTDTAKRKDSQYVISGADKDTNFIRVPRPFIYRDTSIVFAGHVERFGIRMDSIRVENILHFRTVEYKTGFLHFGRATMVQAVNSNAGIVNVGLTSIVVPHTANWWNRWGKPLAAGLLAAAAVDHFKK